MKRLGSDHGHLLVTVSVCASCGSTLRTFEPGTALHRQPLLTSLAKCIRPRGNRLSDSLHMHACLPRFHRPGRAAKGWRMTC